jgi:hypothetical protein
MLAPSSQTRNENNMACDPYQVQYNKHLKLLSFLLANDLLGRANTLSHELVEKRCELHGTSSVGFAAYGRALRGVYSDMRALTDSGVVA